MTDHDDPLLALRTLLAERSARRGQFTLASGRVSSLYIDARLTTMSPEGLALIGPLGLGTLRHAGWHVDAVGGLTLGADPLASAVSLTSYLAGRPLPAFIVRKEPKGHGTGQWMEGRKVLRDGAQVAVLEDVVTTGASTLKAIERVEAEGLTVLGAFALVDRLEGGREAVEARGYKLHTLFTRKDFIP